MKFGNGCWLQKEGCACFSPKQVSFLRKEERRVTLLAPTERIRTRGDTLGGIVLTLEITAPAPEVLRVRTFHHMGTPEDAPAFALDLEEGLGLQTREDGETLRVFSGQLELVIHKAAWSMTYRRSGEVLTQSAANDLALMKTDWRGFAYDRGSGDAYMRQQLGLGVGELVYGLGERFTPLVKNGQSVDIWNEDGGTSSQQAYKNIPFYLTSRGYGVLVNHPEKVSFEIGTEHVSKAAFSVAGESLDYFLINGPTMKEVLMRYTGLTGKPALPPRWSFGLWLSTSFTTSYDEATITEFIQGMARREIPLSVFHFDCFWMKDFHWCDFTWDSRAFPDPEGMLRRLHEKGLKVCVWINPYIAQASPLFQEGMEHGYFLKNAAGGVWQWDMWQPGMAIVDFTNPEACRWYQEKLEALLDMGVDCFKTDFGERIPVDAAYHNGACPGKMHNYYAYLYNKAVYDLLVWKRGQGDAVLFARAATVGCQRFPVHWGGDCWSTYEAMAESLRGGLSLTLSGFGYWSHDIGGFEATSTADVYKRWAAFGLLSTHSRLHGSTSYRVPWAYDEEAVDVLRFFTKLKLTLLPYLLASAAETSQTGVPMMRAMALEYPRDPACAYLDRQYMLGEKLLVAPIFNHRGLAEYYLPPGQWTRLLTGERVSGGAWRQEEHGYLSLPLFVRENTLLPMAPGLEGAEADYGGGLTLNVYELGASAQAAVYEGEERVLHVSMDREENHIRCAIAGDCPCRVVFHHLLVRRLEGGELSLDGQNSIVLLPPSAKSFECWV